MTPAARKKAIRNLAIFLDYGLDNQLFENKETRDFFEPLGIGVPEPGSYLQPVLSSYLKDKKKRG